MTPTLSEVLAGSAKTASFNYIYLVALAAAAGAALFSVVKGLAVYRRGRLISAVVDDKPSLIDIEKQKKIEKLSFLVEELKSEKERLSRANQHLSEKAVSFDISKQKEEVLRKSNLVLARELDKLKNEKEQLVLANAVPLIEELPTSIKPEGKKPEDRAMENKENRQEAPLFDEISIVIEEEKPDFNEIRAAVKELDEGIKKVKKQKKPIRSKKEVKRKPVRVSKKKK